MNTSTPTAASWLPYLALAAGILSLGFSPILIRVAGAPGPVAAFYRMAIAGAVVLLPFALRLRRRSPLPLQGVGFAVLGGIALGLDNAAWATGVMLSGATNPTLTANTAPLWVGFGAWLIFREHLRPAFWVGLVLAMLGSTLVLGLDALRSAALGLGTGLGLVAGVFYAAYFLFTQRGRQSLDSVSYFWLASSSAAVSIFPITLVLDQPLLGYPIQTYLALLALGLLTQVFGWLSINYAQGHLPASVVAPSALMQPVIVALLAGPLLGERFQALQLLGGALVLGGMLLVHRSRRVRIPSQAP